MTTRTGTGTKRGVCLVRFRRVRCLLLVEDKVFRGPAYPPRHSAPLAALFACRSKEGGVADHAGLASPLLRS